MTSLKDAQLLVGEMKPLTNRQYDESREAALARVGKRIGNRPTRAQFTRELGPLWTALDVLAAVIFVAALAVSSVHIFAYMSNISAETFAKATGTEAEAVAPLARWLWLAVHQYGYIALSEASMLLFMVMFVITKSWRRWVFLGLALLAVLFVVLANVGTQFVFLTSLIPPLFTIGIGFNLERLIVGLLKRRQQVNERYLAALDLWERASEDPTKHPDYMPFVRQELWQALAKKNRDHADAPNAVKLVAVRREMERETWSYGMAPTYQLDGPGRLPVVGDDPSELLPSFMSANGHGHA